MSRLCSAAQADVTKKQKEARDSQILLAQIIAEREADIRRLLVRRFEEIVGVEIDPSEIRFLPNNSQNLHYAQIVIDDVAFNVECKYDWRGAWDMMTWRFSISVVKNKRTYYIERPADLIEYGIC